MVSDGQDALREIARNMKTELSRGTTPAGEAVMVRELLGWFGYARRGTWIVALIRNTLTERDLRTVPDFESEYIDGSISIKLDMKAPDMQSKPVDPMVRVRVLADAHRNPTRLCPNDPLAKATTAMLIHDFSQLPAWSPTTRSRAWSPGDPSAQRWLDRICRSPLTPAGS